MGPAAEKITILHFNDVYNIESQDREPVGGAARMRTALKGYSDRNPLILFSGDALAPSIRKNHQFPLSQLRREKKRPWLNEFQFLIFPPVSTFTKGEQMGPVLNKFGTNCAVFGNHDFGESHFILRRPQGSFNTIQENGFSANPPTVPNRKHFPSNGFLFLDKCPLHGLNATEIHHCLMILLLRIVLCVSPNIVMLSSSRFRHWHINGIHCQMQLPLANVERDGQRDKQAISWWSRLPCLWVVGS